MTPVTVEAPTIPSERGMMERWKSKHANCVCHRQHEAGLGLGPRDLLTITSAPTFRESVRALPREAWILFGGAFINRFGTFVSIFLLLFLRDLGYSIGTAGLVIAGYGFGSLIASALGGFLADRLGRKNTITLSMFASAASMVMLSQARSLPALAALTFLAGVATEFYRPASSALLADLVAPQHRVTGFAIYRLAINAGFAIGPAVAGLLADRSFLYVFLGDAATSVVFGIIAFFRLPEGVRTRKHEEAPGEGWGRVLKDRNLLLLCLSSVLATFVYGQVETGLPLHVKDVGLSNSDFGLLVSLNGLLIVLIELPISAWTQRRAARPMMALGIMLTGLGFSMTAVAHNAPLLALTVVVWTFGEMIHAPVSHAYVAGIAPRHLRGRYQGAYSSSYGIAFTVAPILGTRLYAWRPNALWTACLVLGSIGALLVLRLPEKPVEAVPLEPTGLDIPGTPG